MDAGDTEKGDGFLSKVFGSNNQKDIILPDTSDFERELFRHGVYEFDFDKEANNSEVAYSSYKNWLRHPAWVDRAEGVLARFVSSENWDLAWKQAFSGRIPKNWNMWYGLTHSFEEAGKRNVQLSPILITAGMSNSHHLVVNRAGTNQRLTPEQLGIVLGRDDIPKWNSDEVVDAQRNRGMTQKEFRKAEDFAKVVREAMRKARSKRKQLPSSKPQLETKFRGGET